jgi:hypothetical protein
VDFSERMKQHQLVGGKIDVRAVEAFGFVFSGQT